MVDPVDLDRQNKTPKTNLAGKECFAMETQDISRQDHELQIHLRGDPIHSALEFLI